MKPTRTNSKLKGKKLMDPFAHFKQATAASFGFLIDQYDFEHVSTNVFVPECEIKYLNATTSVTITYEWAGVIWVDLARLTTTVNKVLEKDGYAVDILMLERCPTTDIREFYPSNNELPNQYVERVLNRYAEILKEHARDILRGDFRVFSKLEHHARNTLRRRNKQLFSPEEENV